MSSKQEALARGIDPLTGNPFPEDVPSPSSSAAPNQRKQRYDEKKFNNEMYTTEADKMRKLFLSSAAQRPSALNPVSKEAINPIWMQFPSKCQKQITSADEMRRLLDFHTNSDEVFVVRYHQANCVACNALEKTMEYVCHDSKSRYPKLTFYEVSKEDTPELTKGMVRFPQLKGFSAGQWADIEYKPSHEFREKLQKQVEAEVRRQTDQGAVISALQAQEMYFSAAGPSMAVLCLENVSRFYGSSQARLHNYFKQVSLRRTWFFKKFMLPHIDQDRMDSFQTVSVLGEKIVHGPALPPSEL